MKYRIKKLSPHHNGKMSGVLSAILSVLFLGPWFALMQIMSFLMPAQAGSELGAALPFSWIFMLFIPVIYFVMSYIVVAVTCLLYNLMATYLGGVEFELEAQE